MSITKWLNLKKLRKWYFVSGESHVHEDGKGHEHHEEPRLPVVRTEPKVGRNDPCPAAAAKNIKMLCG